MAVIVCLKCGIKVRHDETCYVCGARLPRIKKEEYREYSDSDYGISSGNGYYQKTKALSITPDQNLRPEAQADMVQRGEGILPPTKMINTSESTPDGIISNPEPATGNQQNEIKHSKKHKKLKLTAIIAAGIISWSIVIGFLSGSTSSIDSIEEDISASVDEEAPTEDESDSLPVEDSGIYEEETETVTETVPDVQDTEDQFVSAESDSEVSASNDLSPEEDEVSSSSSSSGTTKEDETREPEKLADEKVVAMDTATVREQPNTVGKILGIIEAGTALNRYEALNNGWSNVLYENQDAYVQSKYLVSESEYTAMKKAEEEQQNKAEATAKVEEKTVESQSTSEITTEIANEADSPVSSAIAAADVSSETRSSQSSGGGSGGGFNIGDYYTEPTYEAAYVVNATNFKVHVNTCHKLPAEGNRIYFNSLEEVNAAGYYDYCGICMKNMR